MGTPLQDDDFNLEDFEQWLEQYSEPNSYGTDYGNNSGTNSTQSESGVVSVAEALDFDLAPYQSSLDAEVSASSYAGTPSEVRDYVRGLVSTDKDYTQQVVNALNEAALKEIGSRLIAVAEAYPDLKASQNYRDTMASIEKYEENVRLSRMTFNDTVTRFNQQVRSFPVSAVAGMLGFAKRDYLADDLSKKDYPAI